LRTVLLLTISNIFMTFAWYGHLKYRNEALWKVIIASWGIAFFEYCFQVPANRIGSYEFNTAQLKTIQEVITLAVFAIFSVTYLDEKLKWNYGVGAAYAYFSSIYGSDAVDLVIADPLAALQAAGSGIWNDIKNVFPAPSSLGSYNESRSPIQAFVGVR